MGGGRAVQDPWAVGGLVRRSYGALYGAFLGPLPASATVVGVWLSRLVTRIKESNACAS